MKRRCLLLTPRVSILNFVSVLQNPFHIIKLYKFDEYLIRQ